MSVPNSRIAVIPARGGSKRIPKKNILNFIDRPMILHTLENIINSKMFTEIHVSTDDPEIQETVEKIGLKIPFLRPAELANDHTPVLDVLKFVLKTYQNQNKNFDSALMVMPCSPLIEASDYVKAIELFEKNQGKTGVLSVAEFPSPPEWAMVYNEDQITISPADYEKLLIRSQDLKKSYYDTGNFSIFSPNEILNTKLSVMNKFLPYILSADKAVDIDTMENWKFAENLYKLKK